MALTGIEIFKHLPKTNCGECGVPTCLAFAMKLAQSQTELDSCPHVTDEGRAALTQAAAPPMRAVTIGVADTAFTVGEETSLFRHEKAFVHPCAIGVSVYAADDDGAVDDAISRATAVQFERVQQHLGCAFISVISSGDSRRYEEVVARVAKATDLPLVLHSTDPEEVQAALTITKDRRPLICAANSDNSVAMFALAKANDCPLVIEGNDLEAVSELAQRASSMGLEDLVISTAAASAADSLRDRVFVRRSALVNRFAPLGYPTISFPSRYSEGDRLVEIAHAATDIAKYSNLIVLSDADPALMMPLLVFVQNLYTDPQRPMQAEAKVYAFNNPGPDAPFFVTTNFSLTYFIVASEIESGRLPAYLGVVESEGLSVLTAWAAGKFVPTSIAKFIEESGVGESLGHRRVIIPGLVAQISGELKEELDGWDVIVGPAEASDITTFLKRQAG